MIESILLEARERRHQVGGADLNKVLWTGVLARPHTNHPLVSPAGKQCQAEVARTAPPAPRTSASAYRHSGYRVGICAPEGVVYGRSRLTVRTCPSRS